MGNEYKFFTFAQSTTGMINSHLIGRSQFSLPSEKKKKRSEEFVRSLRLPPFFLLESSCNVLCISVSCCLQLRLRNVSTDQQFRNPLASLICTDLSWSTWSLAIFFKPCLLRVLYRAEGCRAPSEADLLDLHSRGVLFCLLCSVRGWVITQCSKPDLSDSSSFKLLSLYVVCIPQHVSFVSPPDLRSSFTHQISSC